jgi:hypothetical protein
MLSYQSYWHRNWSESETCWLSFIRRVIVVSMIEFVSFFFYLVRSFSSHHFFLLFFILCASYSQIEYLHRQLTALLISVISRFFRNASSSFMKQLISEHHVEICFQLRDFLRTDHKFSNLVSIDTKFFVTDVMSEWWFWNNQKEEEHFFEDVNSMY